MHLAVDTGIQDIIVTGDFNFDMLSPNLSVKIRNLCLQFSLTQTINEPTHYTENSSSLLDLILNSNNTHLIFSGVGDPFLNQELRFHCPVYGILNFSKPKSKSYQRQTWSYDQGNYNVLRQKASTTDWDTLREQFLLFSTIFSIYIYLKLQESNYIYISDMWLLELFFPQFCKSYMSRYGYIEVFNRVPWNSI